VVHGIENAIPGDFISMDYSGGNGHSVVYLGQTKLSDGSFFMTYYGCNGSGNGVSEDYF
jgi:hypothetical protein